MGEPRVGSITVHGGARVRVIVDYEHSCIDIKIDGERGAEMAALSFTVFGADGSTPAIAVLTAEEDAAEVSAAYRRRLDGATGGNGGALVETDHDRNIIRVIGGGGAERTLEEETRAIMEP